MTHLKKLMISIAAGATAIAVSHQAIAQFGSAPIERFAEHNESGQDVIGYDSMDTVLEAFVVENKGRHVVRYGIVKGQGQRIIEELVTGFEGIPVERLNRDEQLAYWLNLRTLMVLHSTSGVYPSAKPKLLLASNSGFLNTPLITVSGQDLSIKDVDNILLTHWKDEPNLVFGLVVPAAGSPDIPMKAFRGEEVHQQLEDAARKFVNRKDVVKAKKSKVTVSEFLVWHQDHFGGEAQMLAHVRTLAAPKLAGKWDEMASVQSRFDWKLNVLAERSLSSGNNNRGFNGGRPGGFGGGFGGGGGGFGGGS
ncbi:MAG: DUF547 domain-containing protein [Pseudomonadota bacterium]